MIEILCYGCSTHLANTDVARLDWPLTGEMFDVVYSGWFLRPGMLNLDYFCPACGQFPFSHDPYTAGGNAVGKNLNVRGTDGKPVVMTVKQILLNSPIIQAVLDNKIQARDAIDIIAADRGKHTVPVTAFPCPSCGAKKRFHRKGCALQKGKVLTKLPEPHKSYEEGRLSTEQEAMVIHSLTPDPHIAAMEARVSTGPERGEAPTEQDLKDLERDREVRMRERPEPKLRPALKEGYAPKAVV